MYTVRCIRCEYDCYDYLHKLYQRVLLNCSLTQHSTILLMHDWVIPSMALQSHYKSDHQSYRDCISLEAHLCVLVH